jgi:transposase
MTRLCSEDLRERALARFAAGEMIRAIGQGIGIDPSCVPKWVKRKRETSSVAPAPIGGRKPRTLSGRLRHGDPPLPAAPPRSARLRQ